MSRKPKSPSLQDSLVSLEDREVTSRPQPLLPPLDIDLTLAPDELTLPCKDYEQARYLRWRVPEVRSVNRTLSLYDNIPMYCQGEECHWAKLCPTRESGYSFLHQRCPYEVRQIFRQFVQYVQELELKPTDHSDLALIADLCRIDIQVKRIDQQVQIEGMFIERVGGIAQATGKVIMEKAMNPLLERQTKLRQERLNLYQRLMISREARWKKERDKGEQQLNLLQFMTSLRQASEQLSVKNADDVIDIRSLSSPDAAPEEELDFDPYADEEG